MGRESVPGMAPPFDGQEILDELLEDFQPQVTRNGKGHHKHQPA
jgi:hypothetical protein